MVPTFRNIQILALLPLLMVDLSLESPVTTSSSTPPPPPAEATAEANGSGFRPNAEISYFWHQKGHDLVPLFPLESPTTSKTGSGDRVILIHRISDELDGRGGAHGKDPNGFSDGFGRDREDRTSSDDNNIFVFCLMFLFGLIICGLMWCLCTVSRHQVDTSGELYGGRVNSRFGSRRRRADIEVIVPYTRDPPPSYDDIVADFEKLGSQCILPSYKDIMSRKSAAADNGGRQHAPTASPPPRYTSPVGSFSAQGSACAAQTTSSSDSNQRRSSTTQTEVTA